MIEVESGNTQILSYGVGKKESQICIYTYYMFLCG